MKIIESSKLLLMEWKTGECCLDVGGGDEDKMEHLTSFLDENDDCCDWYVAVENVGDTIYVGIIQPHNDEEGDSDVIEKIDDLNPVEKKDISKIKSSSELDDDKVYILSPNIEMTDNMCILDEFGVKKVYIELNFRHISDSVDEVKKFWSENHLDGLCVVGYVESMNSWVLYKIEELIKENS